MSENKESKFIRVAYYVVPILLIAYVMSVGPAAAIIYDSNGNALNPEHEKLAISFYSPLVWVADKNEYVSYVFAAYIEFCTDRDIMADD